MRAKKKTSNRQRKAPSDNGLSNRRSDGKFAPGNKAGKTWSKGKSGNPQGRPPNIRTLSEELRARLQEQYPGRDESTYAQMVAHKLIDLAVAGEMPAIRECFDRTEGRPTQGFTFALDEKVRAILQQGIERLQKTGFTEEEAREYLESFIPELHDKWIN